MIRRHDGLHLLPRLIVISIKIMPIHNYLFIMKSRFKNTEWPLIERIGMRQMTHLDGSEKYVSLFAGLEMFGGDYKLRGENQLRWREHNPCAPIRTANAPVEKIIPSINPAAVGKNGR